MAVVWRRSGRRCEQAEITSPEQTHKRFDIAKFAAHKPVVDLGQRDPHDLRVFLFDAVDLPTDIDAVIRCEDREYFVAETGGGKEVTKQHQVLGVEADFFDQFAPGSGLERFTRDIGLACRDLDEVVVNCGSVLLDEYHTTVVDCDDGHRTWMAYNLAFDQITTGRANGQDLCRDHGALVCNPSALYEEFLVAHGRRR